MFLKCITYDFFKEKRFLLKNACGVSGDKKEIGDELEVLKIGT